MSAPAAVCKLCVMVLVQPPWFQKCEHHGCAAKLHLLIMGAFKIKFVSPYDLPKQDDHVIMERGK